MHVNRVCISGLWWEGPDLCIRLADGQVIRHVNVKINVVEPTEDSVVTLLDVESSSEERKDGE